MISGDEEMEDMKGWIWETDDPGERGGVGMKKPVEGGRLDGLVG